ncbi:hypothetical protein [Plantactinospora sp. B5E13]|uniref:hypothetical protein n=1 Tax=Plantactinospora sp. B5E13 TaxID=3153758 RepID=UPI00325E07E0
MYNAPGGSITVNQLDPASRDLPAPRQLPNPPLYFVNRDAELDALRRVAGGRPAPRPAVVAVLSGPAGTGKTGLALHWAHQVANSYPDGHFFRDLRGHGPGPGDSPVPPEEVLADWLYDGWGLRSVDIPASLPGRAGLFRSRTTGRRVLVVLDNVTDADQVRPLIPATGSSLVLVTSRNQLHGLLSDGAESIPVDELSRENAIQLLRARVGVRVDEEPAAAELLARYCAYLPLTLHTTAARLVNEPRSSIAGQVRRLADEQRRLHRLGHPDDRKTNVEAVFSVSYQTLPPAAQRLFRLLGLHPAAGETAGIYSISRLAGVDLDTAEDLLELLLRENLIGRTGDRYHSRHDLLQLYARHLVDQPEHAAERRAAFDRLTVAYHGCVNHAFDQVNQANPMVDSEFLAQWRDRDPAGVASVETAANPAVWFAEERPNLLALVRSLNAIEPPLPMTPRLACALFYFLETGGHIADWIEVEKIAARVAFDHGDRHDQARSLRNRGRINLVEMQHDRHRRDEAAVTGPAASGHLPRRHRHVGAQPGPLPGRVRRAWSTARSGR